MNNQNEIFHSSPNKDFSDDSLMVQNESLDPSTTTGPALTGADLEDSPYVTQHSEAQRATLTPSEQPNMTSTPVASEEPVGSSTSANQQPSTPVKLVAGQDGDDGSAENVNVSIRRRVGSRPALSEAEDYADSLTREILNDTNELVRSRTEMQQSQPPQPALSEAFENKNTQDTKNARDEEPEDKPPAVEKLLDLDSSRRSSGISDEANREESHWEYKSVLKETAIDSGNTDSLSQDDDDEEEAELQRDSESAPKIEKPAMEFTKNYSDDLLMGQNDGSQPQGESHATNADLADFELPPYSGSSSGSSNEPTARQQSPTIKKAQSSSPSTSSAGLSPPSLTALRDLLKTNYSKVSHIFHWKKPIESGVCFAIGVSLIIALTFFSIISVVAYSTLGLMLASGSVRLYKTVMKTLNRSTDTPVDHIWNEVQALNLSLSHEKMHELVDSSLGNFNSSLTYFKQVLLVEDKLATLKFGAFVYFLTYIGAWFNGMTLITIGYLGLFSVPILYEKNKNKIDELLNLATNHLGSATSMITNKVGSLVSGTSASADKKQD